MYFVKYGKEILHDPRSGLCNLSRAQMEVELNASGAFNFQITSTHPLFDKLKERDTRNPVTVWQDDVMLFCGDILSIQSNFELTKEVECRSELAWLNDSIVRPYSTKEEKNLTVVSPNVDKYFEWLIEQHNAQVEQTKTFKVGINDGSLLDANNYIYRSDTTYPNTGEVLKEKILESLGGFVRVRHEDNCRYIDLLQDFPKVNEQLIDFGVNLLDYADTGTTEDMATFIVPLGAKLSEIDEDTPDEEKDKRLTIESRGDGYISGDYYKRGDLIYSESATNARGWIGVVVEFDDITEAENLVDRGLAALKGLVTPVRTIEVTALDMRNIDSSFEPLYIGQYVRARSKPHNFDSYMMLAKMEIDILAPDNNKFTLGTTFDKLTGVQNKRINALNATINTVYEAADAISAEAKAAAMLAEEAREQAEGAYQEAATAVKNMTEEFAVTWEPTQAPTEGWSTTVPEYTEGCFVWRRMVTTYGNGSTETGEPSLITGNKGADGKDAVLLRIDSTRGTVFKNNAISTVLTAVIYKGAQQISDIDQLRATFGSGAFLQWSWQKIEEQSFGIISAADSMVGNDGFTLTLSADEVDEKCTFKCELVY